MSIISDLNPINGVANLFSTVVSRIWPDKTAEEQAKLAAQLTLAAQETDLLKGQLAADTAGEASSSFFKGSWRDLVGWTCGLSLALAILIKPLIISLLSIAIAFRLPTATADMIISHLPVIDLVSVTSIVMPMLGIGIHENITS